VLRVQAQSLSQTLDEIHSLVLQSISDL